VYCSSFLRLRGEKRITRGTPPARIRREKKQISQRDGERKNELAFSVRKKRWSDHGNYDISRKKKWKGGREGRDPESAIKRIVKMSPWYGRKAEGKRLASENEKLSWRVCGLDEAGMGSGARGK